MLDNSSKMLFSNKKEQLLIHVSWISFKNTIGHERSQTQEYVLDYLHQHQEQAKLAYSDREENSKCLGPGLGGDDSLTAKVAEWNSQGDGLD